MDDLTLRPADPQRDFAQLAAWFSLIEENPSTEESLQEYYKKRQEKIDAQVACLPGGELAGFYWLSIAGAAQGEFALYVPPEWRRKGIGSLLLKTLEESARKTSTGRLDVLLRDDDPESRAFSERRGFHLKRHGLNMKLDLDGFDDTPYSALISRLQGEGFVFTSMEALGNTEEAQRRLYALNNSTSMDIPDMDAEQPWESFEDFQKSVCQADWYRPGGQMVVVDSTSGDWAAMSAITIFGDHGYNLHTGVHRNYRSRKLAQAVKVLALRYARDVLKVKAVHTSHYEKNYPILAIDRKFGYVLLPGVYRMRKMLA